MDCFIYFMFYDIHNHLICITKHFCVVEITSHLIFNVRIFCWFDFKKQNYTRFLHRPGHVLVFVVVVNVQIEWLFSVKSYFMCIFHKHELGWIENWDYWDQLQKLVLYSKCLCIGTKSGQLVWFLHVKWSYWTIFISFVPQLGQIRLWLVKFDWRKEARSDSSTYYSNSRILSEEPFFDPRK